MDFLTLFILALGLCFDTFAVSLSSGMARCGHRLRTYFRFAIVLAFFQGAMPLIGWGAAARFHAHIARYDHWIAFGLLFLLGARMIREALTGDGGEPQCSPFGFKRNCLLGIATSIDALITGVALAMVSVRIVPDYTQGANMGLAALVIAGVTFFSSFIGLLAGRTAGRSLGERATFVGGIILILIGAKILTEHLFFPEGLLGAA